jgi:hypothetical protein
MTLAERIDGRATDAELNMLACEERGDGDSAVCFAVTALLLRYLAEAVGEDGNDDR